MVITATRRQVLTGLAAATLAAPAVRAAPAGVDVAVVGAGVFGAWIAWHLVRSGLKVALVDAYGPGNGRSSSGGESRVIRIAYGEDALYSRWALASLPTWRALSARQTVPIFHGTGVLWFSRTHDAYTKASLETLGDLDVPIEPMDRAGLEKRFPQIDFDGVALGFLECDSGALMARRAVQAVARETEKAGAVLIRDRAGPPAASGTAVRIPLAHGDAIEAATAVYACGAWLPKIFPDLLAGRILSTRQEVFYFGPPPGDRRFAPPAMPVWADFNEGDIFYGLPDLENRGFKIAHDAHGPEFDPDIGRRHPDKAAYERVRDYLGRRFPDLASAPLLEGRVCQYENSSNGDFLIDRHPDAENVWLVGGGSGHGFKHGPALGAYVAERVGGTATGIDNRFRLETKKAVQRRTVY